MLCKCLCTFLDLTFYMVHKFKEGESDCRPENEEIDKGVRCCFYRANSLNCTSNYFDEQNVCLLYLK